MDKLAVGKAIRKIRKSKGITATYMANQLGFKAVSSYTRIEKGETDISLEQTIKIAELLMVDMQNFFKNQMRETRNKLA